MPCVWRCRACNLAGPIAIRACIGKASYLGGMSGAHRLRPQQVLIASDAMTRGMDVEGVAQVVNYDAPVYAKTYVHRCGRTARAGRAGRALTLLRKQVPHQSSRSEMTPVRAKSLHIGVGTMVTRGCHTLCSPDGGPPDDILSRQSFPVPQTESCAAHVVARQHTAPLRVHAWSSVKRWRHEWLSPLICPH